jgi:AAA family ATPase
MRPGRLDRILYVGPPDQSGREEILRIKLKNMSVEDDIDLTGLAKIVSLYISDGMILLNIVTV